MRLRSLLRCVALGMAISATTSHGSPPEIDDGLRGAWPSVAAQFRQEALESGQVVASEEWRLWRDTNRVVTERPAAETGEIWQRDGTALIITRLFHAHRRGIEYQPGDVGMIGAATAFGRQALVVDPAVLRQLTMSALETVDGVPMQRYRGVIAGATWDVTLRRDLMVPTHVVVEHGDHVERITLVDARPLASAAWQPTPSREYELIDFADLGDRERDPFLLAIQAAEGDAHGHAHR